MAMNILNQEEIEGLLIDDISSESESDDNLPVLETM